jgi:tRNA(Ile)-lysidine synthase
MGAPYELASIQVCSKAALAKKTLVRLARYPCLSADYPRNAIIISTMLKRVDSILQQNCFLSPEKVLLVGVSGGPDSLCLMDGLAQLKYSLIVAHLNHGLRPESQSEADFVERSAKAAGLPIILGREDVLSYARSQSLSIEEGARNVRYKFLFEQAKQVGAQAVAVAHTADDQIETVLMHFLRGAGLSGLRGMQYWTLPSPWSDHIPLVRPLLDTWREEIQAYLEERQIPAVQDQTNLDTSIFRNRLRHELIPYLADYNPGIRQVIWRMAQVIRADYDVIEANLESAWDECLVEQDLGYLSFRVPALETHPDGMQRHLIRNGIAWLLPGLRDIDFNTIERAIEFIRKPTRSRRMDLVAGIYMLREGDLLWIASWQADLPVNVWPQIPSTASHQMKFSLPVPGFARLAGGWCIEAELLDENGSYRQLAVSNPDPFQVWIDADQLQLPFTIRVRQPGDRFAPLGMAGESLKLSDFMINEKIPARARANWPLVYSGEKLVWIPGLRLANSCQITSSTRQAIYLRVNRDADEPDHFSPP